MKDVILFSRGRRLVGMFVSNWPRVVMLLMTLNGQHDRDKSPDLSSNTVTDEFDFTDVTGHVSPLTYRYHWYTLVYSPIFLSVPCLNYFLDRYHDWILIGHSSLVKVPLQDSRISVHLLRMNTNKTMQIEQLDKAVICMVPGLSTVFG